MVNGNLALLEWNDKTAKKCPNAQITERWFKVIWPADLGKSQLQSIRQRIKEYKNAKRGTDPKKLEAALLELEKVADEMADLLDQNVAKKNYPNRARETKKKLADFKKIVAKELSENKRLSKPSTATQLVHVSNVSNFVFEGVKSKTGFDFTQSLKKPATVDLELLTTFVNELNRANAADRMQAQLSALDKYETGRSVKMIVSAYGKYRQGTMDHKQLISDAKDEVENCANRISEQQGKICTTVLRNINLGQELEKQYKKSIRNKKIKLAVNAGFAAGSAAAVFLPGTQAFAIYGLARSTAGLIQESMSLLSTINDKVQVLNMQLQAIEKNAKAAENSIAKKIKKSSRETAGTLVNTALGVDIVPTISTANSVYKDLTRQVRHVRFKNQKAIDEVHKLLDECDRIEKDIKIKAKGKHTTTAQKKIMKRVEEQRKDALKLVDKTERTMRPINNCETKLLSVERRIKEMTKLSKVQGGANKGIEVLVSLGALAGGGCVDAAAAISSSKAALSAAEVAAGLAIPIVSATKETWDQSGASGVVLK